MTFIEALVNYLEDEGIGTFETDMFIGELPLDKNDIIALMVAPSPEPNKAIPYYRQTVDVWSRYSSFDDGYGILQDVMDVLHQAEHYELEGYHVYFSYALGMIDDNDRDAERRHLFKLSLNFIYRKASEFS